ncbi:uncharacterized protein LOC115763002 [Drosophila novamexicana]|uniref:uncharacterized protein LOC115763002 n=1 Tax=Drosophila novamexicana TaxID=47314 RepID=UPI0011E5CC01|nr:uncharacterized protein LOC115763002 [Drosophila novamexicana]
MSCFTMLTNTSWRQLKAETVETAEKFGQTADPNLLAVPTSEEGPLFVYGPLIPITEGPTPPPISEVKSMDYI